MDESGVFLLRILFEDDVVLHTEVADVVIQVHILADHQNPHWQLRHLHSEGYLFTRIHSDGFNDVRFDLSAIGQARNVRLQE